MLNNLLKKRVTGSAFVQVVVSTPLKKWQSIVQYRKQTKAGGKNDHYWTLSHLISLCTACPNYNLQVMIGFNTNSTKLASSQNNLK